MHDVCPYDRSRTIVHHRQELLKPKGRKPFGSSNDVAPQVVVVSQDTPQSWGSLSGTNDGREAIRRWKCAKMARLQHVDDSCDAPTRENVSSGRELGYGKLLSSQKRYTTTFGIAIRWPRQPSKTDDANVRRRHDRNMATTARCLHGALGYGRRRGARAIRCPAVIGRRVVAGLRASRRRDSLAPLPPSP